MTVLIANLWFSVRKISPDSTLIEFFESNTESTVYSILPESSRLHHPYVLEQWPGYLLGYEINLVVDIRVCVPYTLSPGDINIAGRHVEQGSARAERDVALNTALTTIRMPSVIRLYIKVMCLHASTPNVCTRLQACSVATFRPFPHRGLRFVGAGPRMNERLSYISNYKTTIQIRNIIQF